MGPSDIYTTQATVTDVNKGLTNHKVLSRYQIVESTEKALLVFGNGDGGGGPLAAILENVIPPCTLSLTTLNVISSFAVSELQQTMLANFPPVSMGRSVDEFFETLKHQTKCGHGLPN